MPISGNVRQGSPNPILRPAPRRQRPDHRPTAAARAVEAERAELRAWLHDRCSSTSSTSPPAATPTTPTPRELMRVAAGPRPSCAPTSRATPAEAQRDLVERLAHHRGRAGCSPRTRSGSCSARSTDRRRPELAGRRPRGAHERPQARPRQRRSSSPADVTAGAGTVVARRRRHRLRSRAHRRRMRAAREHARPHGARRRERRDRLDAGAGTRLTLKVHTPPHAMEAA